MKTIIALLAILVLGEVAQATEPPQCNLPNWRQTKEPPVAYAVQYQYVQRGRRLVLQAVRVPVTSQPAALTGEEFVFPTAAQGCVNGICPINRR